MGKPLPQRFFLSLCFACLFLASCANQQAFGLKTITVLSNELDYLNQVGKISSEDEVRLQQSLLYAAQLIYTPSIYDPTKCEGRADAVDCRTAIIRSVQKVVDDL